MLYNLVEQATGDIPLPDHWKDILKRFRDSYISHPAGVEHDFYICASGASLSRSSKELFGGLNYRELRYKGRGWDIGAYQHCAKQLTMYDLVVFLNSQSFIVIDGWLRYFVEAYSTFGPGVYGASSSFEVAPHIRTSAFAASPQLLIEYPFKTRSRYDACLFEHSPKNFSLWALQQGFPVRVILRRGSLSLAESRQEENIFRRGAQENLIINDRHTLIYSQADVDEKLHLERLADGLIPEDFVFRNRIKCIFMEHPLTIKLRRIINFMRHKK